MSVQASVETDESSRSWDEVTPFDRHYVNAAQQLVEVHLASQSLGLEVLENLIPRSTGFYHAWRSQFERLRGQEVLLVLGMCRLLDGVPCLVPHSCYTEEIVACMERLPKQKVLIIDLRKECRRSGICDEFPNGTNCDSFTKQEASKLVMATAIEIDIASRHFDITIKGVMSFSACWAENWQGLLEADRMLGTNHLQGVPHTHIDEHLGHLGKSPMCIATTVKLRCKSDAFKRMSRQLSSVIGFHEDVVYRAF
ncbi:hypothetical protein B0A48_06179 [Cryoendolithus antarcticus]|uniref:Uncharacterized protein n=1 Tax=Cryoendolithus antarcticus TaxID=1507870 RepID=A0A1V8TAC0_9PEZI|nr:hypothetical protein B0A48_06179 [Cryoendolithus antarcticus]